VQGEDIAQSDPNTQHVEAALRAMDLVVVQDLFLNETAKFAHVFLPGTSFLEKDGTFTNAERRIQRVRSGVPSPGEAKTDYAIFELLAARLGAKLSYTGPAAVFAELGGVAPEYKGIDFAAIGPQGQVWGGETLAVRSKKLIAVAGAKPVAGAPYLLVTGSALYHSGTTSTRALGPLSAMPATYVELGREDAASLGVKEGDLLTVKGNGVELKLKAKVGTRLPKGVVFAPYHFAEAGVNRLYKGETAIPVQLSK
jgi:predicted molibdopterin-dependent oxidoreductase YjgC